MDILLLGITVISLIAAVMMATAAWRVMRDEKRRQAARVAALSAAAEADAPAVAIETPRVEAAVARAPWAPAFAPPSREPEPRPTADTSPHAVGFLGAVTELRDNGNRQRTPAVAAFVVFAVLSGGLVWMMSGPEGTSAVAVGANSPLELVSLSHARQNEKLAVSGLVRNPVSGKPVERVSAVVFLFDRAGTFVASARAHLDFLKLGAGDESPFVVSIDAPPTVARYRVSFRTDDGLVPHIDRRADTQAPAAGEMPVNVNMK